MMILELFFLAGTLTGQDTKPQPSVDPLEEALKQSVDPAAKSPVALPQVINEDRGIIQDFRASWPLFHNAYLSGWLIAVLLAMAGVMVVARDQIFIGAAVSQASTLGIAVAMALTLAIDVHRIPWIHSDAFLVLMAVLSSVIAALVTSRGGGIGKESHEAITGWVFLIGASGSILVVAHSPHGLEEIHRVLSSSIIGATETDVAVFASLSALTAVLLFFSHRKLLLFATDPVMAASVGMKIQRWGAATSALLGLFIGLSIRSSGMLYTFGCLVLPAMIAKNVCREIRPMFVVAPSVATGTVTVALVVANHYDFPPAQMTVALLCLLLLGCWITKSLWPHGKRPPDSRQPSTSDSQRDRTPQGSDENSSEAASESSRK